MNLYEYLEFAEKILHKMNLEASEDNISHVAERLIKAESVFDPSKGVPLEKWLFFCGFQGGADIIRARKRQQKISNLDSFEPYSKDDPVTDAMLDEMYGKIRRMISDDEYGRIFDLKCSGVSWSEIGDIVNMDAEQARYRYKKIIKEILNDIY